jgi:hypothetical protein
LSCAYKCVLLTVNKVEFCFIAWPPNYVFGINVGILFDLFSYLLNEKLPCFITIGVEFCFNVLVYFEERSFCFADVAVFTVFTESP